MTRPRVLVSDALSNAAVSIFTNRGIDVDFRPDLGKDKAALADLISRYDGLAVRSTTKVTAKLLEGADRLKVIGRAGSGIDNIDLPAATAKGAVVMNTPFGNSITTAEHAIAMMFALVRHIPAATVSTAKRSWDKSKFLGVELTGKCLGVVGCGNVGSIVADRAVGLRMRVIALRSLPVGRAGDRARRREGRARRDPRACGHHHPAHAADAADARHSLGRGAGQDQARRADRQLRARRPRRRGGTPRPARLGPRRRRRHRRARRRDGARFAADGASQGRLHAAPRRLDPGGAGERRAADRRADVGLPFARRHRQCRQRPVDDGGGGAQAEAVRRARRPPRRVRRPAGSGLDRERAHHLRGRGRPAEGESADRGR